MGYSEASIRDTRERADGKRKNTLFKLSWGAVQVQVQVLLNRTTETVSSYGETSERRGGANVGFWEYLNVFLNRTDAQGEFERKKKREEEKKGKWIVQSPLGELA